MSGLHSANLGQVTFYFLRIPTISDITDPGQPVAIGEFQAPFSKPDYSVDTGTPLSNTPWHIDGSNPGNQPVQAFGTTASGGASGLGTVFVMAAITNTQNLLPNQLVLFGNVLYGTTQGTQNFPNGGADYGTVFQVNIDGSGFKTLYSFTGGTDGAYPMAGLVVSSDGKVLYGTTQYGGTDSKGVVFSINTDGTDFSNLYSFTGRTDGEYPDVGLVLSSDGSMLYGTTTTGGLYGSGDVFSVGTGGGFNLIYSFSEPENGVNADGANPMAGLVLSSDGVLFGTTYNGGTYGAGVVFSINVNTEDNCVTLHSFAGGSDGANPMAGLVLSDDGNLYGTTKFGGTGGGVVFKMPVDGSAIYNLHSFSGSGNDDGLFPVAGLVLSSDGVLYGTTSYGGGTADVGMVFNISTNSNGTGFSNLYNFTEGNDGGYPTAGLVLSDGVVYGTTSSGGVKVDGIQNGTIFSINSANENSFAVITTFPPPDTFGVPTILHSFSGTGGDGAEPQAQLAISGSTFYGAPPVLYGTTSSGGANGYGTIFTINSDGSDYTVLHSFTSSDPNPQNGLSISGNTLFGTTSTTIFRINTDGSGFATLTNISGASELLLSSSGTILYGTTVAGGAKSLGMVFSINTDGSDFADLHDFDGHDDGESPNAGLDLSPNMFYYLTQQPPVGVLYGTTQSGGTTVSDSPGNGTIFCINTDGSGFQTLYTFGDTTGDGASPKAGMIAVTILENVLGGENDVVLYGTTSGGGANNFGTVLA